MARPTVSVTLLLAGLLAFLARASVLTPNVLPLTVRNPYLSLWLTNARDVPWSRWPIFWTGSSMGFCVVASVPETNDVYPLLGRPQDFMDSDDESYQIAYPLYLGAQFDAATTNLSYQIPNPDGGKPLDLTLSFLSPITPTSSFRQAIPASYISVHVDGDFDIDVYLDLNGDFATGKFNDPIKWYMQSIEFDENGALQSFQIQKQTMEQFTEFEDRAEWGRFHFVGPTDVNFEAGSAHRLRRGFAKHSKLHNNIESDFRGVHEDEPIFAFHKSFKLGHSEKKSDSVLFTVCLIQDQVVQYASERGLTFMRPLWQSWFMSEYALIMFHYLDYHNAVRMAANYSQQLEHDARESGGQDYVDITALSARQVIGATVFSGTPENPLIFLKEISSNGNTQTVDVIFPSFPFWMYTNPRWMAYLLEPLLEHQLSGQYPNKYSMHDLGYHFPNLTGHFDGNDEYMPVEECGDMLIMGLALVNSLMYDSDEKAQSIWSSQGAESHVRIEGDSTPFPLVISEDGYGADFGLDDKWGGGSRGQVHAEKWLKRSYRIWKQWTEYLIDYSLEPENQLCTDDFAGWLPLQANLALKGIVGIKAMSKLSEILGHTRETAHYKKIAERYASKWQEFGMTRDGAFSKLAYDWYGSWTTLYSLFADAILCFHPSAHGSSSSSPSSSSSAEPVNSFRHPHQNPLLSGESVSVMDKKERPCPHHSKHDSDSDDPSISSDFLPTQLYLNQSQHYELVVQRYGLPLDSRHLWCKSDWMHQSAAVVPPKMRKDILTRHAKWVNETVIDTPMGDLYETESQGEYANGIRFTARPVVGSHFSRLVLERSCGGGGWELPE